MSLQPPGRGSRLTQDTHVFQWDGGLPHPKRKSLSGKSLYQPLQTGAAAKCRRSLIQAQVVSRRLVVTPAAEWNLSHPSREAESQSRVLWRHRAGTWHGSRKLSALVSRSDTTRPGRKPLPAQVARQHREGQGQYRICVLNGRSARD